MSWAVPPKELLAPATAVTCPSSTRGTSSGRGGTPGRPALGTGRGAAQEQAAAGKVAELFGPEEHRLTEALGRADQQLDALAEEATWRARWLAAHPGALDRLAAIDVEISGIDEQMDLDRLGGRPRPLPGAGTAPGPRDAPGRGALPVCRLQPRRRPGRVRLRALSRFAAGPRATSPGARALSGDAAGRGP